MNDFDKDERILEMISRIEDRDWTGATMIAEGLLQQDPRCAEAIFLTGLMAYRQKDEGLAIQVIERAHQIDPECREYAEALANIKARLGQLADSIYYAKLATILDPHPSLNTLLPADLSSYAGSLKAITQSPHGLLGLAAYGERRFHDAIVELEAELRIQPHDLRSRLALARSRLATGSPGIALEEAARAIESAPADPWAHAAAGDALSAIGRHGAALSAYAKAETLAPTDRDVRSHVVGALSFQPESNGSYRAACAAWERDFATEIRAKGKLRPSATGTLLTGVLIDEPLDHWVSEVLLTLAQTERMPLIVYQLGRWEDNVGKRLRASCMRWHEAYDMGDGTLRRVMQGDQIDLLLDLTGGVAQRRGRLFPLGTGPATVRWICAPGFDVAADVEFVIAPTFPGQPDNTWIGESRQRQIAHAPFILKTPGLAGAPTSSPVAQNGFISFGAIADLRRITDEVANAWAAILKAVPDAKLALTTRHDIGQDTVDALVDKFGRQDILDRIDVIHVPEGEEKVQALLQQCDIFLEPFPVSEPRDIAQALWMGVPAVVLNGGQRSSAWGAAVLHACSREQWAANTIDHYVEIGVAIAESASGLPQLRRELRGQIAKSPIFDAERFLRAFTSVLADCRRLKAVAEAL
jgi:protein O-GlcNAc transferase